MEQVGFTPVTGRGLPCSFTGLIRDLSSNVVFLVCSLEAASNTLGTRWYPEGGNSKLPLGDPTSGTISSAGFNEGRSSDNVVLLLNQAVVAKISLSFFHPWSTLVLDVTRAVERNCVLLLILTCAYTQLRTGLPHGELGPHLAHRTMSLGSFHMLCDIVLHLLWVCNITLLSHQTFSSKKETTSSRWGQRKCLSLNRFHP